MSKVLIYSQEDLDLILELEKQKNEELQQENQQLKDNWNIIKQEILKIRQSTFSKYNSNEWENCLSFNDDIEPILDKMQELEQGSDSND